MWVPFQHVLPMFLWQWGHSWVPVPGLPRPRPTPPRAPRAPRAAEAEAEPMATSQPAAGPDAPAPVDVLAASCDETGCAVAGADRSPPSASCCRVRSGWMPRWCSCCSHWRCCSSGYCPGSAGVRHCPQPALRRSWTCPPGTVRLGCGSPTLWRPRKGPTVLHKPVVGAGQGVY